MSIGSIDGIGKGGGGYIRPPNTPPPPPPGGPNGPNGPGDDGDDGKKSEGVNDTNDTKFRSDREVLAWLYAMYVTGPLTYLPEPTKPLPPPPDLEKLAYYEKLPDLTDNDHRMLRELRETYVRYEAGRLYRKEIEEVPAAIQAEVAEFIAGLMQTLPLQPIPGEPSTDDAGTPAIGGSQSSGAGGDMHDRPRQQHHQGNSGQNSSGENDDDANRVESEN